MSGSTRILRLFHFSHEAVVNVEYPSLQQVLDAVTALDGDNLDTVSVKLANGDSMDVGGGKDNQYKCSARTCGSFYDLVNPLLPQDMRDTVMIMMSQEGNTFPKCCIVTRDMVMLAIECFCTSGELASSLTWTNKLVYEPL